MSLTKQELGGIRSGSQHGKFGARLEQKLYSSGHAGLLEAFLADG
jgi:hypothetical protein